MVSYAGLWEKDRPTWQIRHDLGQGGEHLEASGDLPPEFAGFRDAATRKRRAQGGRVDYMFDVPLDVAAKITGYRHDRALEDDFLGNLLSLVPINGNVLTKVSQPPQWWQTVGSIKYE
jgi:hypothetical protein